MRWLVPTRFSLPWWVSIGSTTLVFSSGAFALAHLVLGREGATLFAWVFVAALLGDLLIAMIYEALAPTHIVIGPGEREARDDLLEETAITRDGFATSRRGRVRIRGETWFAVTLDGAAQRPGERVRILARDRLELLVARDDRPPE